MYSKNDIYIIMYASFSSLLLSPPSFLLISPPLPSLLPSLLYWDTLLIILPLIKAQYQLSILFFPFLLMKIAKQVLFFNHTAI